jgi:cadmium resistance protein CadD (predicted permease)
VFAKGRVTGPVLLIFIVFCIECCFVCLFASDVESINSISDILELTFLRRCCSFLYHRLDFTGLNYMSNTVSVL